MALLLAGLGAFQYLTLQRSLVEARAQALADDYAAALRSTARLPVALVPWPSAPARPAAPTPSPTPSTSRPASLSPLRSPTRALSGAELLRLYCLGAVPGSLAVERYAAALAERVHVVAGRNVSVIVYDPRLEPIAHDAEDALADIPRMDSGALEMALHGSASAPHILETAVGSRLVVALPLRLASGQRCGVVQLAVSTEAIDTVLARERVLLGVGGGAVLLAALFLGLALTSRALAPLRRLTATARALAAGDLRARSRLEPRRDEVGTLAHSFDDMADRIEAAFLAQAESEARMRRFIADASHELRTPVTALKGYIDVLRRGASRSPGVLDAALDSMAREAHRMRLLVLDLLTLARLDAQRPMSVEVLDLNELLGAVLDEGVPGMPSQLVRDFTPGPLLVHADRNAVVTMVRNLLVNACKYAPGAPQVWSTRRERDRARFSVHDQGPGISARDLPHVFERFYRGEKTRAREEGGSGLGLSIVQGLARALGGEVAIDSAEGAGTTVTVWLPLADVAAEERDAA